MFVSCAVSVILVIYVLKMVQKFLANISAAHEILELISYLLYQLHCCTLPDKRCLSPGMCLYQVMMTLLFLNDIANETESTQ